MDLVAQISLNHNDIVRHKLLLYVIQVLPLKSLIQFIMTTSSRYQLNWLTDKQLLHWKQYQAQHRKKYTIVIKTFWHVLLPDYQLERVKRCNYYFQKKLIWPALIIMAVRTTLSMRWKETFVFLTLNMVVVKL